MLYHFICVHLQFVKRIKATTIGRHSAQEICDIGLRDIRALSKCLGDKKYFLGDKASTVSECVLS